MTIGGIGFGGLASGLDSNAIISQLVALERLPIQLLTNDKSIEQQRKDLVSELKGLVQNLQEKADGLRNAPNFLEFTVTPSVEGIASFSASGEAIAGTHTLEVQSLAVADIWAFDGVADPEADLATAEGQQVKFTVNGTSYSLTFDEASSSLNEIAAEINEIAGDDVNASVVNVGTETTPSYQLVLASRGTGEDLRLTNVTSSLGRLSIDGTGPDVDGNAQSVNNVAVGSNAVAMIDGLTIERSSNDFNEVVSGVSITALSSNVGEPITFTVQGDTEAIQAKVEELVQAYNDVIEFINKQNTYTEEDGAGGELFGDSLLSNVRSKIQGALFNVDIADVQNDTQGFSTLGLIGIKSSSDGTLSIDDTKFQAKLTENMEAVMDLFVDLDGFDNGGAEENTPASFIDTTPDSGLADTLYRAIDQMFGTFTVPGAVEPLVLKSLFDSKLESIDTKIRRINDQIDRKELFVERFEAQLIQRFAVLEQVIGGLNTQGAALDSLAFSFQ